LLKLDDPVIKYLPELKAVHNPFGEMSEITIRHLLNHTAGFRNSTFPYKNGKRLAAVRAAKILANRSDAAVYGNSVSSREANTAIQISESFFSGKSSNA
jgi:CubicO group peptidase (beta-lactamase class C family)